MGLRKSELCAVDLEEMLSNDKVTLEQVGISSLHYFI